MEDNAYKAEKNLKANGINIAFVEEGEGPLVLMCHGWPELSYSWRKQIPAIAAAGFRVVAPDMRGYGGSSAPEDPAAYSILDLVGDMVHLVAALGEKQAVIIGHDWGAVVAWHCALLRPDIFRAIAALSVPHAKRAPSAPFEVLRAKGMEHFYWLYFSQPGVAEAEFSRDWSHSLRAVLYGRGLSLMVKPDRGFVGDVLVPEQPPGWISEAEIAHYIAIFSKTGLRGGFNWYRNIDRNWALTAPWEGAKILQPALFIAGVKDFVVAGPMGEARMKEMADIAVNLKKTVMIPGAGHWIQQEKPEAVNAALLEFLQAL